MTRINKDRAAAAGLGLLIAIVAALWHAPTVDANHDTPPLDDVGVHVLGTCETDNRPQYEGLYDGEHQWLLETWNTAVTELGWQTMLYNLTPNHVDQQTQREVTKGWWSSQKHAGVHTQWPKCYDDALRAMGYDAPCVGPRNVYQCGETRTDVINFIEAARRTRTAPTPAPTQQEAQPTVVVPNFAG